MNVPRAAGEGRQEGQPDVCVAERRWTELLAWPAGSVPPAVAGAVLWTSGSTALGLRAYMAEHRVAVAAAAAAKKD
ncbi:hypothetical protein [Streptomyces silaceus]|uniref:hypothetical protein n=1 Tax=Streptomyces silaceus TaxID=545123 RepID=UPI000A52F474|nr:hypothetical protein [Streptomyces silaceus]